MVKRALLVAPLLVATVGGGLWLWLLNAPLGALMHGGSGPSSLVLLHGYGSRAEDWLQFETKWQLPEETRRVYLQAPLRAPWSERRGWWWLNMSAYVQPGERFPDYSQSHPAGIQLASRLVRHQLSRLPGPIVLGGFSQGAMTSAEVAFQSDQDLAGLILLSGTLVNEAGWAEHFAGRRHLPIFIAHGRSDRILPFAPMERFQARLKAFGLDVTWMPFEGGHGIPDDVVTAASSFVTRVVGLQSRTERH